MIDVYLNDRNIDYDYAEIHFNKAAQWAQEHCLSYQGFHIQDVSDVSYVYDHIAMYVFGDAQDALIFQLRWL